LEPAPHTVVQPLAQNRPSRIDDRRLARSRRIADGRSLAGRAPRPREGTEELSVEAFLQLDQIEARALEREGE
jgi:hypothetical protein